MFMINTGGSFVDIWDGLSDYTTILGEAFPFEDGCSFPSGPIERMLGFVCAFRFLGDFPTHFLFFFFSSPDVKTVD